MRCSINAVGACGMPPKQRPRTCDNEPCEVVEVDSRRLGDYVRTSQKLWNMGCGAMQHANSRPMLAYNDNVVPFILRSEWYAGQDLRGSIVF